MRETLRAATAIVLRAGALAAGAWAYDRLWNWYFYTRTGQQPVGADIGEGLVAFAVVALVAALWAGWDARRRSFGHVALVWLGAGLLLAAAFGLRALLGGSQPLGTLLRDLLVLAPFLVGLVTLPALVGAAVVTVVRSARSAGSAPSGA